MIFEESRAVVLDWLQREHIQAEMRGLRNPAHTVEAELYIRAFVVVEEASRSKHHFLAAQPQTTAMFVTEVRTYLEKCLVDIPGGLVHARSWTTHSHCHIVELELREQPEIAPGMEIKMRHHAAHDVTVMVLRPGAQHPVVVVLILRAILQPEREIPLRPGAQANVFRRIEEIRIQSRMREEAPILLCGKRVQRRARGIAHVAWWLGIGSLSKHMTDA